jgi:hypothetical protein
MRAPENTANLLDKLKLDRESVRRFCIGWERHGPGHFLSVLKIQEQGVPRGGPAPEHPGPN